MKVNKNSLEIKEDQSLGKNKIMKFYTALICEPLSEDMKPTSERITIAGSVEAFIPILNRTAGQEVASTTTTNE